MYNGQNLERSKYRLAATDLAHIMHQENHVYPSTITGSAPTSTQGIRRFSPVVSTQRWLLFTHYQISRGDKERDPARVLNKLKSTTEERFGVLCGLPVPFTLYSFFMGFLGQNYCRCCLTIISVGNQKELLHICR